MSAEQESKKKDQQRAPYERPKITKKRSVARATLFSSFGASGSGGAGGATGLTSA